jgi:hypothetical protein
MNGSFSRNKGKRGESEVLLLFVGAMRQVEYKLGITADDSTAPSKKIQRNLNQSIDGGHDIVGIPFYAVEVKRVEKPQLNAYWKQTMEQAIKAQLRPLLVWKVAKQDWKCRCILMHPSEQFIVADCNLMDWLYQFQTEYWRLLSREHESRLSQVG